MGKNGKKNANVNKNVNGTASNTTTVQQAFENLVAANNQNYDATGKTPDTIVKDLMNGRIKAITKDQAKLGMKAELLDATKPVVTYTNAAGQVQATVDFAKLLKKGPQKVQLGVNGVAANTSTNKPQAKTFGQKQGKNVKGTAANAATMTAPAQGVNVDDVINGVLDRLGLSKDHFAKTEKVEEKTESKKADKKAMSQEEYETLLIKEIIRLNSRETLESGGIKNVKIPRRTVDGSQWNCIDRTRMVWTFQNVRKPDVKIDISITDVQWYAEEAGKIELAD